VPAYGCGTAVLSRPSAGRQGCSHSVSGEPPGAPAVLASPSRAPGNRLSGTVSLMKSMAFWGLLQVLGETDVSISPTNSASSAQTLFGTVYFCSYINLRVLIKSPP
jgi:hypothetical protein